MKLYLSFLSCILFSCNSTIVSVDESNIKDTSYEEQSSQNTPNNTVFAIPEMNDPDVISIEQFGAKGDAIQRDDFSVNGNTLSLTDAVFNSSDVGKIFSVAKAGPNGEHLVGKIQKIINSKSVLINTRAVSNISNVMGSIGTDNIAHIQKAFDHVIAKNKKLFIPEGVYLIGDRNPETDQTAVRINMKKANQNLIVFGAGKDKTILRELDGKTQRFGRYTKMFYHYLKNSHNIGTIFISDLSFDKNGRSLTKTPKVFYAWEQAHCFSWAMSSKELSPEYIDKIHLKNIEIIDKVGAGINFSSGPTKVMSFVAENITERDFNGSSGPVKYGQRGDLEVSCFSDDILITGCEVEYIQIEPVRNFSSDKNNRRVCNVKNSKIGILEYTEIDNKEPQYSKLFVDNLESDRFVVRSIYFRVKDSNISIPAIINSVDGGFTNTTIRIPYEEEKNTVVPVNSSYLTTLKLIQNKMFFNGCLFVIDNDNSNLRPKGSAIKASSKVQNLSYNSVIIENCTFDERFDSSVNAFGNGSWLLKNNQLSGRSQAIIAGAYRNFVSDLTLEDNNYDRLSPNMPKVKINNNNTLWTLKANQSDLNEKLFYTFKGSQGNLQKQIISN